MIYPDCVQDYIVNLFGIIWMQIGLIYFHICPANKHLRLTMRGLPVYCQWLRRVLTFGTFLKYGPSRVTNDTATLQHSVLNTLPLVYIAMSSIYSFYKYIDVVSLVHVAQISYNIRGGAGKYWNNNSRLLLYIDTCVDFWFYERLKVLTLLYIGLIVFR